VHHNPSWGLLAISKGSKCVLRAVFVQEASQGSAAEPQSGAAAPQPAAGSLCAGLHRVKRRPEEHETAAVTLEFGLANLELIIMEMVSICLLFQGDFIFHIK